MSDTPIDANGNPVYPEGMIEAHTAFLAYFGDPNLHLPLQERVRLGLSAALPLLKKAWLLEQQKDHSASTNHDEAAELAPSRAVVSNIARCYLDLRQRLDEAAKKIHMVGAGDHTIEKLVGAYLQQEKRAETSEKDHVAALATIRETREILGASPTGTVQQAAKAIDAAVGFHGSPFPTLIDRVNALNMRAKAEVDGRKQAEKMLDEAKSLLLQAVESLESTPADTYRPHDPETARHIRVFLKEAPGRTVSCPPVLGMPYDGTAPPTAEQSSDPYKGLADALFASADSNDAVAVMLHKLATEDWADPANRKQCARDALNHYYRNRRFGAADYGPGVEDALRRERNRRRTTEERLFAAQKQLAAVKREAARLKDGAPPAALTDEMIVRAVHYAAANGLGDVTNRVLLGLLTSALGVGYPSDTPAGKDARALTRLMSVVESFAAHAEDSGWSATASELRRKAAEAAHGANTADNEVVKLQAKLAEVNAHYQRYQDAVDLVFQGVPETAAMLPNFLTAGDSKAEGIIKLARAYLRERENVVKLRRAICSGPSLRDSSDLPEWKHRLNTALAETDS